MWFDRSGHEGGVIGQSGRYLTARLIHNVQNDPEITGVTFILKDPVLVSVRYAEPKAFQMFTHRIARPDGCPATAEALPPPGTGAGEGA